MIGRNCSITENDFESVECSKQPECQIKACHVCLDIKVDFGGRIGIIKSCGGQNAELYGITGDVCKSFTNKENWDMKKDVVKGFKQWGNTGMNGENKTDPINNRTTQLPGGIHCWDEFAKSREQHILKACQCSQDDCNGASKLLITHLFNFVFTVTILASTI